MYEYKFVRLELSKGFFEVRPQEDYHQLVEEHAKEGWKLLQIFAPPTKSGGFAAYFELVFEREKQ